jgi:hypothetical protein
MFSLFRDFFIGSDWLDKFFGVVALGLVTILIALLGFVVFNFVDQNTVSESHGSTAIIQNKTITPSHTNMILVGKVFVPQYIPESYHLAVYLESEKAITSVSVGHDFWKKSNIGDKLDTKYVFGRFSHDIYIKSVR